MSLRIALLCAALASAGAPVLAQHGQHGSVPQPRPHGTAPQPGAHGAAPQPGAHGAAPQPGAHGSAPQQGQHGSAPQSGDHGSAAQPSHDGSTSPHGDHGSASPASPYAGQQSREIKALSGKEVKDLLDGAGMGLAKAAELNRYPGPSHALENADRIGLSAEQRERLDAIMRRHKAEAKSLGARVVELERELDTLFASRAATPAAVDRITAALGEATARLRAEHLKTHLETTAVLTPAQVARYAELRGYAGPGGSVAPQRY